MGSAVGSALGAAAACAGGIIWFAVTYSYRLEKRALITAVWSHVTPADVAPTSSVQMKASPGLSRSWSRPSDADDSSTAGFIPPAQREAAATLAMLEVAKEMTQRCLRRWDSILALRAFTDSQGRGQGIWRERYEGVRASVMLLALFNLNQQLQTNAELPSGGNTGGKHNTNGNL